MRGQKINRRRLFAAVALLAVAPLFAVCGRRGPLRRPKKEDEDDKKDNTKKS